MKSLFSVLMILALCACSSSSDEKNDRGGFGAPGGDPGSLVNETDYSQCSGTAPAGTHLSSNIWVLYQQQKELSLDMYLRVGSDSVDFVSQCTLKGRTLSAQVTVPARSSSSQLEILAADQRHEKIEEPGFKMDCNVSVRRATMNYRFKGRCLELSVQGENGTITMVPL